MPKLSHSMLKSKQLEHSSEEYEIELFSYIDFLNYILKYKIPHIFTLTPKKTLSLYPIEIHKRKDSKNH